jgi:2-oxoisovalerate dehydrogenase E2 component (dihydrolipoyl transacylase)
MAERVFAMPDLGEGLEEGEVVEWLVAEGDDVVLDQPLVEVETAKATVEIPSPTAARVATLHGAVGETIAVGAPLVTFSVRGDEVAAAAPGPSATGGATPAVRKLAKDLGVDLGAVVGSGPGGRVTADDVRAAAGGRPADEGFELMAVSPVRRTIAQRLADVAAIPQVTTFRTLDCSALDAYRREMEVSPLPVFVAALARTCAGHPLINASWADDAIRVFEHVHVGIAADTDRGLVVPVLRDAQAMGVTAIAAEIRRLAESARGGHLHPDEVTGATIGVSNTGSYGSEAGTPLLNPGNAVTVALGVIRPRALVVDGAVVARPACTISLTFDHRVLDGAGVGRALTELVTILEDATRLRDLPR